MARQPLLVEFAGLPGSGKTTLTRELAAVLKSQNVPCALLAELIEPEFSEDAKKSRWLKILRYLSSFDAAADFLEALSFGCRIKPFRRAAVRRVFYCLDLAWALKKGLLRAREHGYAVVLADQALIQGVWNSVMRSANPSGHRGVPTLLRRFRERIGGCVFFVEIDSAEACGRIGHREARGERPLFKGMDEPDVRGLLERSREAVEAIARKASDEKGAVFVKLNGRNPVDVNLREAAAVILQTLR